jgi:hypothetical protein
METVLASPKTSNGQLASIRKPVMVEICGAATILDSCIRMAQVSLRISTRPSDYTGKHVKAETKKPVTDLRFTYRNCAQITIEN